ncbi:MAG TPA: hypothetical protein VHB73_02405, partial [Alphaproteobacteria bacterium]|nr:hypothetical protein [Alphaproteobacteria bacterium]
YIWNSAAISMDEVLENLQTHQAWGEGNPDAANAYLKSIGAVYSRHGECSVFGFVGQEGGWLHRAQPLMHSGGGLAYLDMEGSIRPVTAPFLRNSVALFALRP